MAQADGGESSADGGGGELTVLVFNLGGGTCDASLISLDAGILEARPCSAPGFGQAVTTERLPRV